MSTKKLKKQLRKEMVVLAQADTKEGKADAERKIKELKTIIRYKEGESK